MRAGVYLRISRDPAGTELGVTRQREDCLELVQNRGWQFVGEYCDNDISATNPNKVRPAYQRLLRDIRNDQIDVVVAWSLDRLLRTRRDHLVVVDLFQAKSINLATCRGPEIDMSTPYGRMVADIMASVAQVEIDIKRDRQRRASLQKAKMGLPHRTGVRVFGFEPDLITHRPDEAALVKQAYEAYLSGVPLKHIAKSWNEAGITGTKGGPFYASSIRDMLLNPRYAGLITYHGEIFGKAQWEPVVDEEVWRAAHYRLTSRKNGPYRFAKYMLSNIAQCGLCGTKSMGGTRIKQDGRADKIRYVYRCMRCQRIQQLTWIVDEYVSEVVVSYLSRPEVAQQVFRQNSVNRDETAELQVQAEVLRARLDELATEFADGELTASQLRVATERLRAQLEDVEARLANAGANPALTSLISAHDVRQRWEELDPTQRGAVVDTLMDVIIRPPRSGRVPIRKKVVPTNIEIKWKNLDI